MYFFLCAAQKASLELRRTRESFKSHFALDTLSRNTFAGSQPFSRSSFSLALSLQTQSKSAGTAASRSSAGLSLKGFSFQLNISAPAEALFLPTKESGRSKVCSGY